MQLLREGEDGESVRLVKLTHFSDTLSGDVVGALETVAKQIAKSMPLHPIL